MRTKSLCRPPASAAACGCPASYSAARSPLCGWRIGWRNWQDDHSTTRQSQNFAAGECEHRTSILGRPLGGCLTHLQRVNCNITCFLRKCWQNRAAHLAVGVDVARSRAGWPPKEFKRLLPEGASSDHWLQLASTKALLGIGKGICPRYRP